MLAAAPLRFSAMFAQMLVECPAQIAAYGACVKANIDNMQKGTCDREFAGLKACSQKVLTDMRAARGRR